MANDFNLDQFPLPKDWTRQELIDCTEDGNISYGIVQPGKHLDEGIPVLHVNNIGNNSLDLDAVMKVDPKIEEKYLRTRLLGGEVLLTLVGSTGQSIIAPEYMKGWNVARAIAVIRADENIGADWINICLQSRETHHYLNSRANTTVQKTLNLKDVRSIPIPIPPLKTKLFIENIATSLSKKIELNRQMNETLEAMAQALFKSWFVDFDPVIDNALAAGNAIPDELIERAEQRKEIEKKDHSDIQDLFPDEFEFTDEMGWIPKGWESGTLGDFAILGNGKTSPDRVVGEIPVFGSNGKIGDCDESNRDNTIIIGRVGSYCGSLQYYPSKCWITDNAMSAEMENKEHNIYLFQLLSRDNLNDRRTGSGQPLLNQSILRSIKTILPSVLVIDEYSRIANSLYEKIYKANGNNEALAKLRDTLLPKLMSGELRITDAEALVNETI